jgi:hypothetical protein
LLEEASCSVEPRASAKLVICLTSKNICKRNSPYKLLTHIIVSFS